jgi:DNA-binding CsgD family transcriptional regulator
MVIANDERRYVAANTAACLLFRLPEDELLRLRVDDLTPPEAREYIEPLWREFVDAGVQVGLYDLKMPDGGSVRVEYSATANVEPGLHLSVLLFPPGEPVGELTEEGEARDREATSERPALLTSREREVLTMVAMGRGTSWIAAELGISPSTVETHVRHCLEKLGARNRAHAIALGLHEGEIQLELATSPP